jgi:hypothetical protein
VRGSQPDQRKHQTAVAGGFRLSGAHDDEGNPDSPLTGFVRQVVHDRHTSTITPAEVVQRIPTPLAQAFPCRSQWEKCSDWHNARCESSVESTIAYCFRSRSGEPRNHPESPETSDPLVNGEYLAHLSHVADRINRGCTIHGITDTYDPRRMAVHRLHGELVAKGVTDPQEIIRVIASHLKEVAPSPGV